MVPADVKVPEDKAVSKDRRVTPEGAISAGLIAQLAGVGWEALWHAGLSSRVENLGLSPNLGFLGDHIVSNLGVLSIVGGVGWLIARKRSWRRGALLAVSIGAAMQVTGAAWDLAGHVRGSENNPVPYFLLGFGFVLVVGGLLAASRRARSRG
jgi:hypothetical protein